jgi:hypothetical protein
VFDKNEVKALYAAYKAIEEMKIAFADHGTFRSLEATCHGVQGFWVLAGDEDPKFIPKEVVEGLSSRIKPTEAAEPEPATAAAPEPAAVSLGTGWDSPDIRRRLNDIVEEAQSLDTRYIRVISKSKAGKQTTLARIAVGTSADSVVKIIMHARRRTKDRTVMAEVLKKNLKRTMARSFPLELVNA